MSSNLRRRITEHQGGKVASTAKRRPVKLIGYEACVVKSDAARRERYLKTTEGKRFFRQQYRDIITSVNAPVAQLLSERQRVNQ